MRALFWGFALILAAFSDLHAQSTLIVTATKPSFIWGEPVKVTASLIDNSGNVQPSGTVTWTVIPDFAASIASDGTVTPRALMSFTVRGTANGISSEMRMQALPKQIRVTPDRTSMLVGSSQKIRAEVLDVTGQPIPNVAVNWAISSLGFGGSSSATIDGSGTMKAVMQARVRVVARIFYNPTVPGFDQVAQGDALVDVKAPTTYKFERVFVSRQPAINVSTLAPRAAPLIPTESGGFMFAASLDGLGSALLEWNNGNITPLLTSGRVNLANGFPLADFANYGRTSSGEVLVQELDLSGNRLVSRGRPGVIAPAFSNGSPVFGAEFTSGFDISRNSVADSGAMLMRVGYTDAVTHLSQSGLFRGFGGGISEPVMNTRDSRIANGESQGWFDLWGIANDGTAWFQSVGTTIWRSRPGQPIEKMLAPGDQFGSDTVLGYASNFATVAPLLFVAGNGDVVNALNTNRGQRFLLWHDGDRTPSSILPVNNAHGLYWYDPNIGALIDATIAGRPRGLYLWNRDGSRPLLVLTDRTIDGSPVEEILSAANTSDGTIYVMVRTSNNPMVIARLSPNPQVLLKAGDSVPVSVPPVITALIPGARAGMPMVLAGGASGSIARLDGGGITPIVAVGSKLPDGKYYVGSQLSMVRTVPDGRIVFGNDFFARDSGLYTWDQGALELTVRAPMKHADGTDVGYANNIEVNRQGDVAFQFTWNGYNMYRLRGRTVTTALDLRGNTTIDNIPMSFAAIQGIDDAGNIFFRGARPDNSGFHIGIWDGNTARISMSDGMQLPDGRQVNNIGNVRACADGFVAGAVGTVLRYRNGTWNYLADPAQPLASGAPVDLSSWTIDANRQCDVVFIANLNGPATDIGARIGSSYHEIQNLAQFTPEGDLLSISQMLINDDASIYVLGANDRGEEVIYSATPIAGNIEIPFTARSTGGFSSATNGGPSTPTVGYARVDSVASVSGLAIFGNRQNGVLVSEAAVPASRALRTARIYAEVSGPINTGVAIANPNSQQASITYSLTRTDGSELKSGVFTVDANKQTASFLDQAPFNSGSNFIGTLTLSSTVPISVIALRGNSNARGEFLITTLPVIDLGQTPSTSSAILPHFATGGGWTTEILLVNSTDVRLTGSIEFYGPGTATSAGSPNVINAAGQNASRFSYQISARSSYKLLTSGTESATRVGSVRVIPDSGQTTPASLAVFTFTSNGIVVSEAGVSGFEGNAMQMYTEVSGPIQSGLAIANPSSQAVSVTVELKRLDGSSAGVQPVAVSVPANGQVAKFVNELFPTLTSPFQGVLRLTSGPSVSVAGLRARTNERGDFLITTTPPSAVGQTAPPSTLFFPHLVDGGGYTTQFIVIGGGTGDSSGTIQFFDQTGQTGSQK